LFIFRDQARHHIKPAAQHMPPNQVAHHGIMTQLTSHKYFIIKIKYLTLHANNHKSKIPNQEQEVLICSHQYSEVNTEKSEQILNGTDSAYSKDNISIFRFRKKHSITALLFR
jgi:hypothetical protein